MKQQEREKNKKNQIKKVNIDEETIFHYLVLGYDTKAIKYKLGIELKEYKKIVDKFIKEGRITEEEIKEARIKKGEEDKKKVYEYLNMGKTQREIAKEMDVSQTVVQTLLKKVKAEYQIDNKEIMSWKNQLPTSVENKKEAILEGLRQGMSVAEIAQTYSNQGLTEGNVIDWIKKLKAKGKITKEEILQARQNRRKYITNKEHLEDDAKILEYLKKGYIAEEIAKVISRSMSYVYVRTREMCKEGKITKEEIKQAQMNTRQKERQQKKEQEEKEKREKDMQVFKRLKREIDIEVRLGKKPSDEQKEKIREYIDLCHEIYMKEKISMAELEFLERAMQRIEIKYEDIVQYSRRCIEIGEYTKPLTIIQKNKKFQVEQLSKKQKEKLQLLEQTLVNACRVNRAIQLIQRGNTDTKVISQTTGLSKDEANILKIQLMKKQVRLLSVMSRNKIVDKLVNFKDPEIIKQKYGITDFEMEDMVEQASCKRGNSDSNDIKDKVLQDSRIRIEMLLLKLGKEPERIARTFNLEYEMFQMDVHAALEFGLIKLEELNGIDPLSKR